MNHYIDQAPLLYFTTTDEGTLSDVNDTLCASLLYDRTDLIGKNVESIYTLATRIFQQTHFYPLLKMQGHAEEIFITLRTKDGDDLPVLLNATRKTVEGTILYVYAGIVVRNRKKFEEELIAARKAAETALKENTALQEAQQALKQHTEALEQQIRLVKAQHDELQQFSRVVTHDMQEPLRKLTVFTGMLQEENLSPGSQKAMEKVRRVLVQMGNILSGLQQYIWLNEKQLKRETINLKHLLAGVVAQLEDGYPAVELELKTGDLHAFEADRAQMKVLFYQLLSNAIRFSKPGKPVQVSIASNELQLNKFQHVEGRYQYEPYLRVIVQDTGVGFEAAYKQQTFELFRRFHKESGRGIGLSLCKKIIDHHQGSITIDSQVDVGTTVTILLPISSVKPSIADSRMPN